MEPKTKKITNKKLLKQIQATEKTMERYAKAKDVKIECLFCKGTPNLWTISRHLKSEKCMRMKALVLSLPDNENTEAGFLIYINNLKHENLNNDEII